MYRVAIWREHGFELVSLVRYLSGGKLGMNLIGIVKDSKVVAYLSFHSLKLMMLVGKAKICDGTTNPCAKVRDSNFQISNVYVPVRRLYRREVEERTAPRK